MKKSDLTEVLRAAGADQGLIEACCRATAPARHAERVAATVAAAKEFGVDTGSSPLAVIVTDLAGVGGSGGITGEGTARLLKGLGTSRWQAADGEAYLSAAVTAALTLADEARACTSIEDGDGAAAALFPEEFKQLPREWALTVAGQVCLAILRTPVGHARLAFARAEDGGLTLHVKANGASALLARVFGNVEEWVAIVPPEEPEAEEAPVEEEK